MARLSISEMTTYRWSFEQDVEKFAAAGIPAISVWRHKLSDYGEEKGQELLREHGLAVSTLMWAGGFTGSEGHSYRECVDDARGAIRQAAALGAECLTIYSGTRAGHTHNHARRLFLSALEQLLPIAEEFGVTLAVEPLHADALSESTFLCDLHEAYELIAPLVSDQLKLSLDTYHFGNDAKFLEQIPDWVPRLAIVHLGDRRAALDAEQNRCRLGEGVIPLATIVSSLCEAGYTGYFDVKLMGEEFESSDYDDLIIHCRQAFDLLIAGAEA